jgi:acyl-CoA thioester hydrolase
MPYQYEITRGVEFSETDLAGIMHFSNFFRFMEAAEHAFFRSLGFSVAQSRDGLKLCLPRVHAECDYAVPLRFEDEVRVQLLVERKGRRSLTYQFRFSRLDGLATQEVARGRLTVVCAERQADCTLKAVPLPQAVADKIQEAPAQLLQKGFPPKASSFALRNGHQHERARASGRTTRTSRKSAPQRVGAPTALSTKRAIRPHSTHLSQ